ncbi:hypothetical protein MR626_02245 [bacterium]|nr:hypothetical protein [bacterium]
MDQNVLFYRLEREAKYALNSHSRDLVYQTFGAAKMAFELEAITKAQFYRINDMLVVHGLNDPSRCRLD